MLKIEDVSFSYAHQMIFSNLNLVLDPGDRVVVTGPSGCGKSTLFQLISGALPLNTGFIDKSLNVAYMAQKDFLLPWKTLHQNLMYAFSLSKNSAKITFRLSIEEALSLVDLKEQAHLYPHQLSGGMRQRASLAQVLLFNKECVLLDEPFSSLDSKTKDRVILNLLHFLKKSKTTLLMISHDTSDVIKFNAKHYAFEDKKFILKN
jgi:ABC-type nitrate/sulfonate/bicarbonate transport system ATPase subunit